MTTLREALEGHSLEIGGYGIHCSCGTYFAGFGPDPRPDPAILARYPGRFRDETLGEHLARAALAVPDTDAGLRSALDGLAKALHDELCRLPDEPGFEQEQPGVRAYYEGLARRLRAALQPIQGEPEPPE